MKHWGIMRGSRCGCACDAFLDKFGMLMERHKSSQGESVRKEQLVQSPGEHQHLRAGQSKKSTFRRELQKHNRAELNILGDHQSHRKQVCYNVSMYTGFGSKKIIEESNCFGVKTSFLLTLTV